MRTARTVSGAAAAPDAGYQCTVSGGTLRDAMLYDVLADAILFIHFAFILFVGLGGLLVVRWRWVAWGHVPAVVWGVVIEIAGWICPLTPVESWLRIQGGGEGYQSGFVEHWLVPVIYPAALTRGIQIGLGVIVLLVNLGVYVWVIKQAHSGRR